MTPTLYPCTWCGARVMPGWMQLCGDCAKALARMQATARKPAVECTRCGWHGDSDRRVNTVCPRCRARVTERV